MGRLKRAAPLPHSRGASELILATGTWTHVSWEAGFNLDYVHALPRGTARANTGTRDKGVWSLSTGAAVAPLPTAWQTVARKMRTDGR